MSCFCRHLGIILCTCTSVLSAIHLAMASAAKPIRWMSMVSLCLGLPLGGKCMKTGAVFNRSCNGWNETLHYIYIMFLEAWWVLLNHSVLSFKTGLTEIWTWFLFTCTQIVTFINDFKHLIISLDVSITLIITKIKSRVYLNCRF